ncbi:hypothetical protein EMQ_0348 [Acetobacter aceti NBRC 14818]|uniref:Transposase n=1 Tax=Acetobacter aceti NBRC 14818 TaxID=887700 RepID=A0AB33IFN0_ACEAC|nr:hypothetical protein EMQ_0348 [Acetobacter aceti NBRC 14818]GAN58033.1 hypothetical protein Abac_030_012 [Acetobacter aceti NBRC 14818]
MTEDGVIVAVVRIFMMDRGASGWNAGGKHWGCGPKQGAKSECGSRHLPGSATAEE